MAENFAMAESTRDFAFRASPPGGTRWRPGNSQLGLLGQFVLDRGPARGGRGDHRCRMGDESCTRVGRIEKIEPLAEYDPKRRKSRGRKAARDADRVVTAIARHIDVR